MRKELTKRKIIRLPGYDYSQAGRYFITICVKNRHNLLWSAPVGANCVRPELSDLGLIVEKELFVLSDTYHAVKIFQYVIMPNHLHMIIAIMADGSGRTQFAPTIARIIKQFKGSVTKQAGYSIWQKSYHDHIIRSEDEYQRISRYIDENPCKWQEDCYYNQNPHTFH